MSLAMLVVDAGCHKVGDHCKEEIHQDLVMVAEIIICNELNRFKYTSLHADIKWQSYASFEILGWVR